MSKNYSANQYESAFLPKSLNNWEVPKFVCKRPNPRSGSTLIVANSRGHLLPGVPRADHSPWGEYQGTWSIPLRITRQQAEILNGITQAKKTLAKCQTYAVYSPHFILHKSHKTPVEIEKETTETKTTEKPEETVRQAECAKETIEKVVETKDVQEIEKEPKILCPIHDLYQ